MASSLAISTANHRCSHRGQPAPTSRWPGSSGRSGPWTTRRFRMRSAGSAWSDAGGHAGGSGHLGGGDPHVRGDAVPVADVAVDADVGEAGGQADDRGVRLRGGADIGRIGHRTHGTGAVPLEGDGDPGVGGELEAVPEHAVGQVDAGRVADYAAELVLAAVVAVLLGGL